MDLQDYMVLLVLSLFSPSLPFSFLISFLSKLALLHIFFCLSLFFFSSLSVCSLFYPYPFSLYFFSPHFPTLCFPYLLYSFFLLLSLFSLYI